MTRPSPEQLLAEAAELASRFHWPLETILDLEHADRQLFLDHARSLVPATPEAEWPA
jgi:hypothetical protein